MIRKADSRSGCYRVYGITLESDTAFPELLSAGTVTGDPQVSVRLMTRFPRVPSPTQWIRQWPLSTGEPWLHCGKLDSGYLIWYLLDNWP